MWEYFTHLFLMLINFCRWPCDENYLSANIVNNYYILYTSNHYRWKAEPHASIDQNTTLMHSCCVHAYIIASHTLSIHVCHWHSIDLHNPWVILHNVAIDILLHNKLCIWICCPIIIHGLSARYLACSLRKVWIKQTRFWFVLRSLLISGHAKLTSDL